MKVINLIGQPGAGKSTLAAGLFYELKRRDLNVELVTEYTKDLHYERNDFVLGDELLVFSEKYKRIKRLSRSVDFVLTDSALVNSLFYSDAFGEPGKAFFRAIADRFENIYIFVERAAAYVPQAREPDEEKADRMAAVIRAWLDEMGHAYYAVRGDGAAPYQVVAWLEETGIIPAVLPTL